MFNFLADTFNVKNLGEILAPSVNPETQLHQAIEDNLLDKITHLIDVVKVDPNARNSSGNLPIHTAAYSGSIGAIEILLKHNADLFSTGHKNNTCLHYASSQGHLKMVQFLVSKGLNPALRNDNGKTPYDVAKGDVLRQYLLPLQFRNEDPMVAAAALPAGITPSIDPDAPKPVLAPPPTNPIYSASHSGNRPQINVRSNIIKDPTVYRPIQADGFGTSVGNAELMAKYGNTKEVKKTAAPPPIPASGEQPSGGYAPSLNPYAQGRYTTYDANTNTGQVISPPMSGSSDSSSSTPPKGAVKDVPKFTIFNPSQIINSTPNTYPTYNPAITVSNSSTGTISHQPPESPQEEVEPIDMLPTNSAVY